MKGLAVLIALCLATAACRRNDPSAVPRPARDAQKATIRSVDFRNFTYKPGCVSRTTILPGDSDTVTTENGAYESSEKDIPVQFVVSDVIYGDLRGDGNEEAVVLTGCNLGGTGYWTEAFIFELRDGQPVEIDTIGGNDRAMGGIESVRVEGHSLQVAQKYGVALCCADYIETTAYQLRGDDLVPVGPSTRATAHSGSPLKALRFDKGTSSGRLRGEGEEDAVYELRARAGQELIIERLSSEKEQRTEVGLGVLDPDGMTLERSWDAKAIRVKLPFDGLYTLVVSANQNVPYEFKVTIH